LSFSGVGAILLSLLYRSRFEGNQVCQFPIHSKGLGALTHKLIRKLMSLSILLLLVMGLSFSLEQQAHAYVDPGSGLLVFQSLSAIFTGALFYFRRHLRSLLTRKRDKNTNPEQP
jgi:hypothetical protein